MSCMIVIYTLAQRFIHTDMPGMVILILPVTVITRSTCIHKKAEWVYNIKVYEIKVPPSQLSKQFSAGSETIYSL